MPLSYQCMTCKHYMGLGGCLAFLDGIPEEIFSGLFDHTKPYKGDGGLRWEPWPDDTEESTT